VRETIRSVYLKLSLFLYLVILLFILATLPSIAYAQDNKNSDSTFIELDNEELVDETSKPDSNFVKIEYGQPEEKGLENDSTLQYQEVYPLDIASDRGLFILSPDRMMQMRILGSVRVLMNYGDQAMPDKYTFNPYEIPMYERVQTPNFFANLALTRLGFEVTRRTKKMGDLFVRIETDFAGSNGYRLRHAYGQIGSVLIGKTWTLFNNANFLPATVSRLGPAGATSIFTPQVRYSRSINDQYNWQASIEYSTPDINLPDSIDASLLQVIPDVVGRLNYRGDKLSYRVSALITTISATDTSNTVGYSFGFAGSFSGMYTFSEKDQLHFSATFTTAASRFIDIFSGKNEDISYNPNSQTFYSQNVLGGYVAWSHTWPKNISSSLAVGSATIFNKDFQLDDEYHYSYNTLLNIFWQPVEGARLGIEFASGERHNKGGERGRATRLSILMYYDF